MSRLSIKAIYLVIFLLPAPAHAGGPLPSVVKTWSLPISADHLVVQARVLYIKSGGQVTAVSLRSGRQVWSRDLGEETCCTDDILIMGSSIVTAAGGNLFFLDAADGTTRSVIDLGGGLAVLAGPPAVALLSRSNEILAADPDSGQVTGRLPLSDGVGDLAVQDGALVVNFGDGEEGSIATVGFTADTLKEMWRIETPSALPQIERIGGRLHLERWNGELLPLDPLTGRLGQPLPPRRGGTTGSGWPEGVESLPGRLRRVDPASGKAVWTAELPGPVEGLARDKDLLFASCGDRGGRSLLVEISWTTGDILLVAEGLPRSHQLLAAEGLILVATDDEVAAFSATAVGPPAASLSVDAEVSRILLDSRGDAEPLARGPWIDRRLQELAPLGAAAWPAIVRLLPRLGPTSLVAAADALAAGGDRAAAPALARRLTAPLEEPPASPGLEGWNPQLALLRALARLGGDAEVPAIDAVIDSRERRPVVRREALAALAAMRSPAADRVVRTFLARPLPARRPWNPPAPPPGSLAVNLPDSRTLVLFRDGYLGSPDDLWIAKLDRNGRQTGPSLWTGIVLPAGEDSGTLRARIAGDKIQVLDAAGRKLAAFDPAAAAQDSDGDGLPDLAEKRLRLDPAKTDTDGDGLADADDPAPNARLREPVTEDQEIAAAIFRHLFQLEGDDRQPEIAVVVSDAALEWLGRGDLTITLDAREAGRFLEETAGGGVPLLSFQRGEPPVVSAIGGDPPGAGAPPVQSDEAVYTVTIDRGPLHPTVIYRAVVRNLNAGQPSLPPLWTVRDLRTASIGYGHPEDR